MALIMFHVGANVETFLCVYVPSVSKGGFNMSQVVNAWWCCDLNYTYVVVSCHSTA